MRAESEPTPDSWEIAGRKVTKMRDQLTHQATSNRDKLSETNVSQRLSTVVQGFSKLRQKMLLGNLTVKDLREEGRRF